MIFLDTSFLFPLFYAPDPDHARVRAIVDSYRGRPLKDLVLTTNHVVLEAITLVRVKAGHSEAVRVGEALFHQKLARIHYVAPEDEHAAFAYLRKYHDQEYSMVDCLSFVVMEKLAITEALAIDSDFNHRFTAIPGPRR